LQVHATDIAEEYSACLQEYDWIMEYPFAAVRLLCFSLFIYLYNQLLHCEIFHVLGYPCVTSFNPRPKN